MRHYVLAFPNGSPKDATLKRYDTVEQARKVIDDRAEAHTAVLITDQKDSLKDVPTAALLTTYNDIRGTTVKKFADRDAAVTQTLRSIQVLDGRTPTVEPDAETPSSETAPTTVADGSPAGDSTDMATKTAGARKRNTKPATKKGSKTTGERALRLVEHEPKAKTKIRAVRAGTKSAQLIDMLARPNGATLSQLEEQLSKSGKKVNPRAWMSWTLNSVVGYGVRSERDGSDIRCYLKYPEGMRQPVEHTVKAEKAKGGK